MAAQPDWGVNYIQKVKALIAAVEECRTEVSKLAEDAGLPAAYLAAPNHRTDLVSADFTAANAALIQMLFTWDSGSPHNKASCFKLT